VLPEAGNDVRIDMAAYADPFGTKALATMDSSLLLTK
jgi:hypothetical protein